MTSLFTKTQKGSKRILEKRFTNYFNVIFLSFRCTKYTSIPAPCTLIKDAAKPCCFKPVCNFNPSAGQITGQLTTKAPQPGQPITPAPQPGQPNPNPNPGNPNPYPTPSLPKGNLKRFSAYTCSSLHSADSLSKQYGNWEIACRRLFLLLTLCDVIFMAVASFISC